MKKIVGLTIVALLVIGLVGGGTWAYFTDTEESTGNSFTAGSLNLVYTVGGELYGGVEGTDYTVTPGGGDGVNGNVVFGTSGEGLKPGDSGYITWTLSNTGTVPGSVTLAATVTGADNTLPYPEEMVPDTLTAGELQDCIGVILTGESYDSGDNLISDWVIYGGYEDYQPLSGLNTFTFPVDGDFLGDGVEYIVYTLEWLIADDIQTAGPDGILGTEDDVDVNDNIIMTDSAVLNITFILTQWDAA